MQAAFEQDRVIVRLQQRVLREESIVICYLTGSYGQQTEDGFSDIDVVLVFPDQASRDRVYNKRREFVQSILPYVPAKSFDASHIKPHFHIALYSNGSKVDFHFETLSDLRQADLDIKIRLLKDTVGWATELQMTAESSSPAISKPVISSRMLVELDERYWIMFMDIYRLLRRGDVEKSFPIYIEQMYFTLPKLLRFLPQGHPARLALISSYFGQDVVVTLENLRLSLKAYVDARTAIVDRYNLAFVPDSNFEREIFRIIQKT